MIRVPRPDVPQDLATAAAAELDRYRLHREAPPKPRAKGARTPRVPSEGFRFTAYQTDGVKDSLEKAFHAKCAYCEGTYAHALNVRIEHFRPKGRLDREGMKPAEGYYWLAADWSNLLPSCERCNSPKNDFIPALGRKVTVGKANWFPLWEETKRAAGPGGELEEYPLLLNPCIEDPEQFLAFDENGMVEAAAALEAREKAKAEKSIHFYGLGRQALVGARREYAKRVLGQLRHVFEYHEDWTKERDNPERRARLLREWEDLNNLQAPDAPFLAMTKRLIRGKLSAGLLADIDRLRTPASGVFADIEQR